MSIHPLACVSSSAEIGRDVTIGPFSVIESNVTIGDECILENNVIVKQGTTLGAANHLFDGVVVGGMPQHAHMPENPGRVVIGDRNVIRENVTIHRALDAQNATLLGDGNLLMVNAHVAHDCRLGNQTILTNNVMLAGHVSVDDKAYLSGAAGVHQFCRVGTLAMIGGQGHIKKDVPPYVTIDGLSSLAVGLNRVGLRRAGFSRQAIEQLKAAYRVIYRDGGSWSEVLAQLEAQFASGPAAVYHEFLSTSQRGITPARQAPREATIRLSRDADDCEATEVRAKAG